MVLVLSIGSIFLCPLVLYYIYLTKKLKDKNENVNDVEFFEQNAVFQLRGCFLAGGSLVPVGGLGVIILIQADAAGYGHVNDTECV